MAGLKIKKGDTVQVITGKDRGLKGKVITAYPETSKLLVEGANRVKKHLKVQMTARGSQAGGIVVQEAPMHVSNVMVVCPNCGKPSRVGFSIDAAGHKVRICRRCKGEV